MICKLDKKDYFRTAPLFSGLDFHLVIFSIIAGNSPGDIYVDDPVNPRAAFVWDKTEGGYYLAGDTGNSEFTASLNRLITGTLKKEAMLNQIELTFDYYPANWESYIEDVFASFPVLPHKRRYFEFSGPAPEPDALPEGFRYVAVDSDLIARDELENIDDIKEWIEEVNWGDIGVFMERGLGWCVVSGNTIVSWCIADYSLNERLEIGIHTDERFRRKGFAVKTVRKTLAEAVRRGFSRIGWHCWSDNAASAATALQAGFREVLEHQIYHRWYNEHDNFLVRAWYHYELKQHVLAAADYDDAFALDDAGHPDCVKARILGGPDRHWIFLNAARCYSLTGQPGKALACLEKSVESGFDDAGLLEADIELDAIRRSNEFDLIMTRLKRAK